MPDDVHIHDGCRVRPLNTTTDLGYHSEQLLESDGEMLYDAEAELLTRARRVLEFPPSQIRGGVKLSRDDTAVLANALVNLGRLRLRRLEAAADPPDRPASLDAAAMDDA